MFWPFKYKGSKNWTFNSQNLSQFLWLRSTLGNVWSTVNPSSLSNMIIQERSCSFETGDQTDQVGESLPVQGREHCAKECNALPRLGRLSAQYWPNLPWGQFNNTLQVTVLQHAFLLFFQLITTPEVIELLIVMMQAVKNEGDDRWRKISRAVTVNAMKERKKERKIER